MMKYYRPWTNHDEFLAYIRRAGYDYDPDKTTYFGLVFDRFYETGIDDTHVIVPAGVCIPFNTKMLHLDVTGTMLNARKIWEETNKSVGRFSYLTFAAFSDLNELNAQSWTWPEGFLDDAKRWSGQSSGKPETHDTEHNAMLAFFGTKPGAWKGYKR